MTRVNKFGLSDYIPEPIAYRIRQECGFGCIECGDAFFHYHHIDPPFMEAKEHDAEKIGLLCGACHDKVTRGIWSNAKIIQARQDPYCKKVGFSHTSLDIAQFGHFVVRIGDTEFINLQTILQIDDEDILAIYPPEEPFAPPRISARFFDRNNCEIAAIDKNEWRGSISAFDIEAKGSSFQIRSAKRKIDLEIGISPPNLLTIERLELAYNNTRISGSRTNGFSVRLPQSSLFQVLNEPEKIEKAPFWLCTKGDQILFGRDFIGAYKDIKGTIQGVPGHLEIRNAEVEIVDSTLPPEVLPPDWPKNAPRKALKITAPPDGDASVQFHFDIPKPKLSKRQQELQTFGRKVERNELCPCGSGKKYKHCHLKQFTK